jgi:vacuolar-type H+-ATPase subunit I/STV1
MAHHWHEIAVRFRVWVEGGKWVDLEEDVAWLMSELSVLTMERREMESRAAHHDQEIVWLNGRLKTLQGVVDGYDQKYMDQDAAYERLREDMWKLTDRNDELERMGDWCEWVECEEKRHGGWRFCKGHLKESREELKSEGYLESVPRNGSSRTGDMMEDILDTQGGWSPSKKGVC